MPDPTSHAKPDNVKSNDAATTGTAVDLILKCRWIIPVVPAGRVLEHTCLVIDQGNIIDITPTATAERCYQARETVVLDKHVVTPGLVNAHNHAAMTLLRGFADDQPLKQWLEDHIWPTENRWVSPEFVADGTRLALADMITSGTTTFSDMYFFPENTASVVREAGLRAQLAFPIFDFPCAWGTGPDDYFHKGLALHDKFRSHPLIDIAFGPHAPYTVSDGPLSRVATLAEELQACIQIHAHETAGEVKDAVDASGERPLARLNRLGLLSPLTQLVHMTELNDEDIDAVSQSGAHVIHCPSSNLKLASGFCPVQSLMDAGVNVAIGTDGAASNNQQNLLNEINLAALLAKAVAADAAALNAHSALNMATLAGAKALGIDQHIGSLENGKQADIIAIDLSQIAQQPIYDVMSTLMYSGCSQNVTHVWVAGKALMTDRHLQTLDRDDILARSDRWRDNLQPKHRQ